MSESGATVRRRLCVAVDIQGYSRHSGSWQREAQRCLAGALDDAAIASSLRREDWWRQESGDGEVAVIDDDGCEPILVERFPHALSEALRTAADRPDIRVRVAVHHGITERAAKGWAGDGVIDVCRIVDSDPARSALDAAPGANLVLALSERTFLDIVRSGHTTLRTGDFRRVSARNKDYSGTIWLLVPGSDPVDPVDEPGFEQPPDAQEQGPASVRQTADGGTVVQAGRDANIGSLTTVAGDLYAPILRRRRG